MKVILMLATIQLVQCYNILVLFGSRGRSHYDVFKPLFRELGEKGHHLTIISNLKSEGMSLVLLTKNAL